MSGTALSYSIDGKNIEAMWWGAAADEAPTIVLLHEGLGCVTLWRDVPARLADMTGCGVLAYSRFGYGASAPASLPRPLSYMHNEALQILPKLLDAAGLQRIILLGHSDGGSIATIYAGGVQDFRLRGVVLIAPHFVVEDVCITSIEAAKTAYETTNLRERLGKYHAEPDNAFWGWNGAWLDPAFRSWRIDDYIPTIRVPVLVLQGAEDEYGTEEQLNIAVREAYCPVETMLISGAKHAPQLSHAEIVLSAVSGFVGRILAMEKLHHNA
jgi:pimeloyl-ACP methyl ester carboxylesterase